MHLIFFPTIHLFCIAEFNGKIELSNVADKVICSTDQEKLCSPHRLNHAKNVVQYLLQPLTSNNKFDVEVSKILHMRIFLWLASVLALLQLDFTIHRGEPRQKSVHYRPTVKRDGTELTVQNNNVYYMANLEIGSDGQRVQVILDTGSSDLWVPTRDCRAPNTNYDATGRELNELENCSASKIGANKHALISETESHQGLLLESNGRFTSRDLSKRRHRSLKHDPSDEMATESSDVSACTSHGTYNTDSSETFEELDDFPDFEVSYGDGSGASGKYGTDDVVVGNTTLKSLTFAFCSLTDSESGVLGIGPVALEATNDNTMNPRQYDNFPLHLKKQGLIKRSLYSVSLGKNNALEGSVLFGAVDHSKYTGKLERVKVVNRWELLGSKASPYLEIILDSITGKNLAISYQTTVTLDTGSTINNLPAIYVLRIGKHLRGNYDGTGHWMVDCKHMDLDEKLNFDFSGVKIEVPIKDLVLDGLDGSCYLGVFEQNTQPILGESFLRNAYVVYDLEAFEIALAPASDGLDGSEIEEVIGEIPLAVKAPRYNSTEVSQIFSGHRHGSSTEVTLVTSTFSNTLASASPDTTDDLWKIESDARFTYTGTLTVNGTSATTFTMGGHDGHVSKSSDGTPETRPCGLIYVFLGLLCLLATV